MKVVMVGVKTMVFKFVLAMAVVLAAVYLFSLSRGSVSSPEAHRLVEAGALLVDVRTPGEFSAGHLPGAVSLPVQELEPRMAELGGKDRPIVVYCRSGSRSGRAKRVLEGAGFTAVHDLGAMSRW
jgi:phage shock protein E